MPMYAHDPVQFLIQLRQTLSADKLSVGFLIGAGCPCSIRIEDEHGQEGPLIPDIRGLTNDVESGISNATCKAAYEKLTAILKEDNFLEPNIETILKSVRSLKDVAGKSSVRGMTFDELSELDIKICEIIRERTNKRLPQSGSPYHAFAKYIQKRNAPCVEIFTTNYDLLMEQALEEERVPYFDGFIGVSQPFFDQRAIEDDEIPKRWGRLWKLHGSVNWRLRKNRKGVIRSDKAEDGDELLIHPSHMKYDESRRMPYFVMIDRLRNFLRNRDRPVALIVLGYSFGDQHLNEAIVEALKVNASSACFALQFSNLASYGDGLELAKANGNLSLLCADGAVIRGKGGPWMATAATNVDTLSAAFKPTAAAKKEVTPSETTNAEGGDAPFECELLLGDFKQFAGFLGEFSAYGSRFGESLSG